MSTGSPYRTTPHLGNTTLFPASFDYEPDSKVSERTVRLVAMIGGAAAVSVLLVFAVLIFAGGDPPQTEMATSAPDAKVIDTVATAKDLSVVQRPVEVSTSKLGTDAKPSAIVKAPGVLQEAAGNAPVAHAPGTPRAAASPKPVAHAPRALDETASVAELAAATSGSVELTPKTAGDWQALGAALTHRHGKSQLLRGASEIRDQPVAGTYSWMVELLPYLGHESVYREFDLTKSWTDCRNLKFTSAVIPEFLNPADPRKKWEGYPFNGMGLSHFVGISGIEESRNDVAATLPRSDPRAGVFGYDEVARPEQITDGASNTLMIIGSGELASPWVQGGGATVRGARAPYFDDLSGFGSRGVPQPGAQAMFADGSVRMISKAIDPKVFKALCTTHGAETVDSSRVGP